MSRSPSRLRYRSIPYPMPPRGTPDNASPVPRTSSPSLIASRHGTHTGYTLVNHPTPRLTSPPPPRHQTGGPPVAGHRFSRHLQGLPRYPSLMEPLHVLQQDPPRHAIDHQVVRNHQQTTVSTSHLQVAHSHHRSPLPI